MSAAGSWQELHSWTCLLACVQRNSSFGKQKDSNCTSDDLLNVASNDGNFDHNPHQQPGSPRILSSACTSSWLLSEQISIAGTNMCF